MTKVYQVYGFTPFEGDRNFGIFSTKEKAEEHLKEVKKNDLSWETYGVEEFTLDEPE
jgi:hypothetical protein